VLVLLPSWSIACVHAAAYWVVVLVPSGAVTERTRLVGSMPNGARVLKCVAADVGLSASPTEPVLAAPVWYGA
jgi:hypothetical protein